MASAGRFALIFVASTIASSRSQYYQQQTRSLSGTPATDGNNVTNAEIYRIITQQLLDGFAIWRVKMFNDRVFVEKTRRSYWLGDRYYRMDNDYYWKSRDTCAYRMNETERRNLVYEDGIPIYDIIYQCQRYAEYCCGLDCCRIYDLEHPTTTPPWRRPRWNEALMHIPSVIMFVLVLILLID
ncbi:CX module [Ancylostoma caninum]|uniref:CX module n=1 Tax=Ancylostoma caninum TaxID=29170 RepID=A0A368GY73_ANCCA|nr:CX module [Ancylostoma caninum]